MLRLILMIHLRYALRVWDLKIVALMIAKNVGTDLWRSEDMTYEELRNGLVQDLCENAYLGTWYGNDGLQMIIEAIEKQIPKKPIRSKLQIRYCEVWKCPDCGFEFSGRVVNFCYRCGQAIDWSDTE